MFRKIGSPYAIGVTSRPDTKVRKIARGPYRSGTETRQRLIDTALALFGAHGFDATSTRDIATRTGVALPAITYHFGSKEGLYRACAEHVVERYRERMRAGSETFPDLMPAVGEPSRAALRRVVALLATMLPGSGGNEGWMTFMMREMNGVGPAHDLLYRDLWEPGLALVAALVAGTRGCREPADDDRLEALLLLSSFSAFTTARQVALDFGGWPAVDQTLVEAIVARLHARIDAL